jgi:hypothetical protein
MSDAAICKNCMYNASGKCSITTNIKYVREFVPSIQTIGQFREFSENALWREIDDDGTCKFFERRERKEAKTNV